MTHRLLESLEYDPALLPPDEATIDLGHLSANWLRTALLARQLHEKAESDEVNIVDLGSGTGILGAIIVDDTISDKRFENISLDLTAVDNDPVAVEYSQRNISQLATRIGNRVISHTSSGDWHTDEMWQSLPDQADLIVCNPPYLTKDEQTREGYDHVNPKALFVEDQVSLENMLTMLTQQSMQHLKTWGIYIMRLPRDNQFVELWPMLLERQLTFEPHSSYVIGSYRYNRFGARPGHALGLQKLPPWYQFIDTNSDPSVDILLRHDRVADPEKIMQRRTSETGQIVLHAQRF